MKVEPTRMLYIGPEGNVRCRVATGRGVCGRGAIWHGELSPASTPEYAFFCSEHVGWLEFFWRRGTKPMAKPEDASP